MRKLHLFILATIIAVSARAQQIVENGDTVVSASDITEVFKNATSVKRVGNGIYKVLSGKRSNGFAVLSNHFSSGVNGFAGPTPLLIGVSDDGTVVGVKLLKNEETPSFINKLKRVGLFNSWNGLKAEEARNKEVDAVSGATYSSSAIIKNVRNALANFDLEKFLPQKSEENKPVAKKDSVVSQTENTVADTVSAAGNAELQAADSATTVAETTISEKSEEAGFVSSALINNVVTIIVALIAVMMFFSAKFSKKYRLAFLFVLVGVLGIWQKSMLSVSQFVVWLHHGVNLELQYGLLTIAFLAIVLPLFGKKKFYCIYVCPFGAAQELAGKCYKHKRSVPEKAARVLLIFRKALFVFVVFSILIGLNFQIIEYEPFTVFNIEMSSVVAIVIAAVSLLLSVIYTKPWCRYVCPLGQALDLFVARK